MKESIVAIVLVALIVWLSFLAGSNAEPSLQILVTGHPYFGCDFETMACYTACLA